MTRDLYLNQFDGFAGFLLLRRASAAAARSDPNRFTHAEISIWRDKPAYIYASYALRKMPGPWQVMRTSLQKLPVRTMYHGMLSVEAASHGPPDAHNTAEQSQCGSGGTAADSDDVHGASGRRRLGTAATAGGANSHWYDSWSAPLCNLGGHLGGHLGVNLGAHAADRIGGAQRSECGDESDAWLALWRQRFACWWLALPGRHQAELGGCAGALMLHVGSRLDAAWRASVGGGSVGGGGLRRGGGGGRNGLQAHRRRLRLARGREWTRADHTPGVPLGRALQASSAAAARSECSAAPPFWKEGAPGWDGGCGGG